MLKGFLKNHAVQRVLFIDDGFDPLEQVEPTEAEQGELWAEIEASGAALTEAVKLGINGPDDLTGDCIAALLERGADDPLGAIAETAPYVVEHRSKANELKFAIEYLSSLEITVCTAGRETWRDKLDGVSIVFLDWRLGPEADKDSAVQQACKTAKEIHSRENKPLIVLMSSDPAVKDEAKAFSEQSGLIPGLFDALPKRWLKDRIGVDLQMAVLGDLLQKGHVVQGFVDAIRQRAIDAITTFINSLQGLTLSDYANLQHFALKHEGHPLGDYLTELLAGVWVDALFQGNLREQLNALDKEDFESLPALVPPSEALLQLYKSAVFDKHVGDFSEHPHRAAEPAPQAAPEPAAPDPAAEGDAGNPAVANWKRLSLSLGDVVLEYDGTTPLRAYVILNPQCDLAESPRHRRKIDDDLSILLAPGLLRPVGAPERTERKDTADTPFFADGETRHRIQWEGKKLISVPYRNFDTWIAEKERRRKARMRLPYALALQRSITSDLSRVGLPVPPPMYEEIDVKVRRASLGTWDGDPVVAKQGRLLMARDADADQVVLTHSFVVRISEMLNDGLAVMKASNKDKDATNAAKIEALVSDPAEWQKLAKPFSLPAKGLKFLGGAVLVCREGDLPSGSFDRKHIVCVSLPDDQGE
jgi:hypothetical protein